MVCAAISGLMLEGARINAAHPAFTEWAYVGRVVGRIEGAMGAGPLFHRWLWLVHVLFVYGLLLKEEGEVLMPAMAEKIPAEEDRWKVVSFVRTLAAREAAEYQPL